MGYNSIYTRALIIKMDYISMTGHFSVPSYINFHVTIANSIYLW